MSHHHGIDILGAVSMTSPKAQADIAQRAMKAGQRALAAGQRGMSKKHPKTRDIGARAVEAGNRAIAAAQKLAAKAQRQQQQVVRPGAASAPAPPARVQPPSILRAPEIRSSVPVPAQKQASQPIQQNAAIRPVRLHGDVVGYTNEELAANETNYANAAASAAELANKVDDAYNAAYDAHDHAVSASESANSMGHTAEAQAAQAAADAVAAEADKAEALFNALTYKTYGPEFNEGFAAATSNANAWLKTVRVATDNATNAALAAEKSVSAPQPDLFSSPDGGYGGGGGGGGGGSADWGDGGGGDAASSDYDFDSEDQAMTEIEDLDESRDVEPEQREDYGAMDYGEEPVPEPEYVPIDDPEEAVSDE